MLFRTAKRLSGFDGNELNLSVNGSRINTTTNYKYLGVHLDPTLNLDMHFCKTYKKAAGRVNLLRPRGALPIMAYTGRLRLKGVPFPGFRYIKG